MSTFDDEDPDYMDYSPPLFTAEDEHSSFTSARSVSRRVNTKRSTHFKASLHEKLDLHQIYSVQIWCTKVKTKVK